MAIEIRITGLDELASKFSSFRPLLRSHLEGAVGNIINEAASTMKSEAPNATSTLRESIETSMKSTGDTIEGEAKAGADYAYYVEKGRPNGAAPPIDNIVVWMQAKGFDPKGAYALAKRIGERGVKANDFTKRTFDRIKSGINNKVVSAVSSAIRTVFK